MRFVSEDPASVRPGSTRRVKHVNARQLSGEEERVLREQSPRAATLKLATAHTISIPSPHDSSQTALDPTQFAHRRRKRNHAIQYRLTQVLTALAFVCGMLGLVLSIWADEADIGNVFSILGVGCGGVALFLSDQTQLASRLKGYAAAAVGLSVLALAMNLIWSHFHADNKLAPQFPSTSQTRLD